jgi:hypothetical protein
VTRPAATAVVFPFENVAARELEEENLRGEEPVVRAGYNEEFLLFVVVKDSLIELAERLVLSSSGKFHQHNGRQQEAVRHCAKVS